MEDLVAISMAAEDDSPMRPHRPQSEIRSRAGSAVIHALDAMRQLAQTVR